MGRWPRHDLREGAEVTPRPEEPATYGAGIHPLPDGGAVLGRLLDEGFEITVRSPRAGQEGSFLQPGTWRHIAI